MSNDSEHRVYSMNLKQKHYKQELHSSVEDYI